MEKKSKPGDGVFQSPPKERQVLDKKAEEYLREGGNIEDMPNAKEEEDEQKLIKALKQEEKSKNIDHKQGDSKENHN